MSNEIGIYNWGLVLGKTQTNLNWYTMTGSPNPDAREWQHDVMYPDGTPYDGEELSIIRRHLGEDLAMAPVDMIPKVMQDLEDRGLIIRLRPGAHPSTRIPEKPSENRCTKRKIALDLTNSSPSP